MKIAIAGYGMEGAANLRYFRAFGDVTVFDERIAPQTSLPEDVQFVGGQDAFARLHGFDLVVRTAGLAPRKIKTDGKIWSATNEFFAKCPAPIIGVTGTKGKGTTCSLIASVLRAAGKTVHLVGNIGTPALDVLPTIQPDDVVVYELSSFQLWDAERSPHIAVVLMIEPDHLDVHENLDEYLNAKSNIRKFQQAPDVCIYHPTNLLSRRVAVGEAHNATTVRYGVPDDGQVYVRNNQFFANERMICDTDTVKLPGAHNIENACAAISAVLACCPDITSEHIAAGLEHFTGLPHRLKFIAEKHGVRYFDDSIATTPGSAIAAIRSFATPVVLILGGSDKGAQYDDVLDEVKRRGVRVHAIGETGRRIEELAKRRDIEVTYHEGLMNEVVPKISRTVSPGDTVILSPASASFDQYQSYVDRGDQFIAAVEALE